jgi:hypothetical protein
MKAEPVDYSWNNFDATRIKGMNILETWKENATKIPSDIRQTIKGLLLILHLINYTPNLKFVILSDKLFEVSKSFL